MRRRRSAALLQTKAAAGLRRNGSGDTADQATLAAARAEVAAFLTRRQRRAEPPPRIGLADRRAQGPADDVADRFGAQACERNVAIGCAQHMATYVARGTMLPSAECRRRCRGIGAYQRNIISARLTAFEPRARRGWCHTGHAWRFSGPTRSSAHRLSSVLASTYTSAESSDSWSDRSATVAMSHQPKICCADDSTIANAAFPTGRDQNASSQMRLGAKRGTQHSSARIIGRQRNRAMCPDGMSKAIARVHASERRTSA
jgi:hypothetical protein